MSLATSVLQTRQVTDALIDMLHSATGKPVGDHIAPTVPVPGKPPAEWPPASLEEGYTVVYGVPGGSFDGAPFWSPEADGFLVYQVTSVSIQRGAAEWLADRVRLTMLSRSAAGGFQVPFPALAGMRVTHRAPDGTPPGVMPEGPPTNRTLNIPERFRLYAEST